MPSSSAVVRWFVDGNAGLIDPDNVNFMFNSHSDLVDGIITCCGEVSVYFGQELRKKVCVKKSVCVCVCVSVCLCSGDDVHLQTVSHFISLSID